MKYKINTDLFILVNPLNLITELNSYHNNELFQRKDSCYGAKLNPGFYGKTAGDDQDTPLSLSDNLIETNSIDAKLKSRDIINFK